MAQDKKSFIIYTSWNVWLEALNNEQKGIWLDWVMKYCNDKEPELPEDPAASLGCLVAKDILKRDLQKYEEKKERLRKVGKQYKEENETEIAPKSKPKSVSKSVSKSNRNRTEIVGVNVNVNDNVNVNVNDNNKNITSYEDNILSQTLRYWNDKVKQYRNDSFKVSTHKTIIPSMEKAINKAIQLYGFNNLTLAIEHYMISGSDKNYYFKYVWSLEEFCKQSNALPEFLNEGSKWTNYCNSVQGCKRQEQTLLDQITIEDMKEFFI